MNTSIDCSCKTSSASRLDQRNVFMAKSKTAEICVAFTSAIDFSVRLEKGSATGSLDLPKDRRSGHFAYLEQLLKRGYDPSEPRDWHGRWTTDGGAAISQLQLEQRSAAVVADDRHGLCVERCMYLLERRLPFPGSDRNTWDFQKCYGACMREAS